jgi:RNA polymerase sigma-70 factor (ECF subfamily)
VTDDADLVARAREGDHAAFGELVDRHSGAAYRMARAALGSPQDAEDAAQEAFVLAYQKLGTFRGEASFKTWLLTIVWRQSINQRRGVRRVWKRLVERKSGDLLADVLDGVPAAGPTPEQSAVHSALRREIQAAIRGLSPKLRDALLLSHTGDYTYEEIGALLSIPVGTVKWRVSEARRAVRARLHARGYRPPSRQGRFGGSRRSSGEE